MIRDGKLTPVFVLQTTDWHSCTYHREQEASFSAKAGALAITVHEKVEEASDDCDTLRVKQRTVTDTWHWDAAKNAYVPGTGALDRLNKTSP